MIKCELDKHQCDHLSFSRSSSFLTPQKCLTRSCRSAISSPGGSRLSGQDQNKEHEEEEDGEDQDNLPSHICLSGYQDQNQDQDYDESQNQNQ